MIYKKFRIDFSVFPVQSTGIAPPFIRPCLFTLDHIDQDLWPALKKNAANTKWLNTTIFSLLRRGRSSDDISSTLNLRTTIQNKLSSFCKTLATKLNDRIQENKYHTSTKLFELMSTCLDIKALIRENGDEKLSVGKT